MTPRFATAAALLEELAIEVVEEIEVEAIAHYCGATVVYEPLRGCEARIVGHGDRAMITVNQDSSEARKRFSAAHELGHWLHDRGKAAFGCTAEDLRVVATQMRKERERRANKFASELLLPASLFGRDARQALPSFAQVRDLATRYRTSLTATAIRLVELSPYPLLLFCSDRKGKRLWFTRSPELPQRWWPKDRPGKDTVAQDLLFGGEKAGNAKVSMSEWFDLEDVEFIPLVEDSVVLTGEVLSLLFWDDAEAVTKVAAAEFEE